MRGNSEKRGPLTPPSPPQCGLSRKSSRLRGRGGRKGRVARSEALRFIRLFGGLGQFKSLTLQGVLGVMQGQESLLQVFVVAVAVGASLQGSNFVVDAFQRAGRERVVVPVEQTPAVLAVGLGHDLHLADARGVGAAAPGFEVLLGSGLDLWFQNCRKSSLR